MIEKFVDGETLESIRGKVNDAIDTVNAIPSKFVSNDAYNYGGKFATVALANAAITNATNTTTGKNNRDGKRVDIGINGNYVPYWWNGGFADGNLVEYFADLARKTPAFDYLNSLVALHPNLYVKANVVTGKYINPANGLVATIANGIISEYISVTQTKSYKIAVDVDLSLLNFKTIAFYDANKSPLGWSKRNSTTGLPDNTNCTVLYSDNGWLITGMPTGTVYTAFQLRGNDTTTIWNTATVVMQEGTSIQPEVSADILKQSDLNAALSGVVVKDDLGKQTVTPLTYVEGSFFNVSGGGIGNPVASATWLRTNLVPVTAGDKMYLKGILGGGNVYLVFYNAATPSNSAYMSFIKPNLPVNPIMVYSFDVPAGATYMGIDVGTTANYTFAELKVLSLSRDQSFSTKRILKDYTVLRNAIVNPSLLRLNVGGTSIDWQDGKKYTTGPQIGQYAKGWQTLLLERVQFAVYNNYAQSGFALSASATDDGKSWIRQKATWAVADIFVLNHGTNDFGLNRPLGTTADYLNKTGDLTFYGALREFIDYCYLTNPLYQIILITPLQRASVYTTWTPNSLGFTLNDYAEAIRYVGTRESLPVIDLLKYSGLNLKNMAQYFIEGAAGLHPFDAGYEVMAREIIPHFLKYYK